MNEREKLIELLRQLKNLPNSDRCADCPSEKRGENCEYCGQCKLERDADYLIEKGVKLQGEN